MRSEKEKKNSFKSVKEKGEEVWKEEVKLLSRDIMNKNKLGHQNTNTKVKISIIINIKQIRFIMKNIIFE